jgi:hypothetical protein
MQPVRPLSRGYVSRNNVLPQDILNLGAARLAEGEAKKSCQGWRGNGEERDKEEGG